MWFINIKTYSWFLNKETNLKDKEHTYTKRKVYLKSKEGLLSGTL